MASRCVVVVIREALESVSDKELTDTCSEMQSNELKVSLIN
jgi:hypothetical protein